MSKFERSGCDVELGSRAMSEVGGLLNLAEIGIKKTGHGGRGGDFGAKRQKILHAVKIKNSAALNKIYALENRRAERGC